MLVSYIKDVHDLFVGDVFVSMECDIHCGVLLLYGREVEFEVFLIDFHGFLSAESDGVSAEIVDKDLGNDLLGIGFSACLRQVDLDVVGR